MTQNGFPPDDAPLAARAAVPNVSRASEAGHSTLNSQLSTGLTLTGIEASIGGSRILRGVSFQVQPRSVFCLMGRNGVGKTSTLNAIVGLLRTNAGRITFGAEDLTNRSPETRARRGLGFVPQGREIFPHLTVEENLQLGAMLGSSKRDAQPSAAETRNSRDRVFSLFPILKDFLQRKGGMLSGGQQQQLAIARALLTRPQLLILDEPTEGIQPNIIDQVGDAIKLLRSEGEMSVLLVEQYLDFCRELADEFAIMDRGAVVASGPVTALTDDVVKAHLTV